MDYCKFLQTQDEAIEHCRLVNRGLSPTDPDCCAVVAGPGDNFAVVDLETAKDLLDEGNSGLTCLIVTDYPPSTPAIRNKQTSARMLCNSTGRPFRE
jgi:hypothetical protein